MNTAGKYWIIAIVLVGWSVLSWLAGSWLNLQGNDLWILRASLLVIGFAAFATALWWFRGLDEARDAQIAEQGAADGDEIDILIRRALIRLRARQAGKGGLADWPTVFVMGETGSAKTSVVLHGGLEAQLLAGRTVQNNIPIPTRALNLWLAPPFLILEAGGPLLHEPLRWAKLVKKLMPSGFPRALGKSTASPRAALICVDCERLVTPGVAESLSASVNTWRGRLRDISELLGINLPVYVLFTRADRLQFFQDYVAPLSNEEASQVVGATLPVAAYAAGAYTEKETTTASVAFDNLFSALADRRLLLLSREPDPVKLTPIYEFPREFKKFRSILVPLLVDLCRPGPARTNPFLRGFYFTGVRPIVVSVPKTPDKEEPAPQPAAAAGSLSATRMFDIKKAAAAAAQQLGASDATETRRIPQWVFLPRLFKDVLFKDTTALSTSTFSTRMGLRKRFLLATAMGILLLLTAGFTLSSVRNKRLADRVMTAAQEIADVHLAGRPLPSLDALKKLETLRQLVETLALYQREGPPLSMRCGLYVGNSLLPDARRIYFEHFNEMLFQPAQSALLQTLSTLPPSPGPHDRYDPVFDSLKAYLLTTSDSARSNRAFLSPFLARAWAAGRYPDPARVQLAQKQFDFYADQLKVENPFPSEVAAPVVARARQYLSQFPGEERVYRVLLSKAEETNPSINFSHRFPTASDVIDDQFEVSGAFTRSGWSSVESALENLSPYFNADLWVLGQENPSPEDLAKHAEALRSIYLRDYIAGWRSFLRRANITRFLSLADASQKLQKLASDQSPLLALFCVAAQNTTLDQADVANTFQAVQSVVPHDCRDQYAGPTNTAYLKALSDLQACVDRADSTPAQEKDSAKAQCMSAVKQTEQAVQQIAEGFQVDRVAHADQTVRDLLLAPVNTVADLLRPGPVSAAGLCAQMAPLESVFPFRTQASRGASLPELAAVFAPTKGALSQFYASSLKNLLLTQNAGYVPNPASTQKVRLPFLSFFNRAMGIQKALYPAGTGQLQFRYALRPRPTENISSLTLSIDGQSLTYPGGNAPFSQFTWPGTSEQGVRLTVQIPGGTPLGFPSYDGMWGAFHFFADATVLQHTGNIYTLEWVLGGDRPVIAPNGKPVVVQFELDTQGELPILEKGVLSDLRCVSVVAR